MRLLFTATAMFLAGCQPVPVVPARQAGETSCTMIYQDFSANTDLAIRARGAGDMDEALYRMMAADINLELLIARDCCRFDTTCPAMVGF